MITGPVLRERDLATVSGRQVHIRILRPEATPANIAELRRVSDQWRQQALALAPVYGGPRHRAIFASDTAYLAAETLVNRSPERRLLLALGPSDEILGIVVVQRLQDGTWDYSLQTAAPQNMPGWPGATDQLRGVGNELTGEMLKQMIAESCSAIHLTALDDAAARHWQHLGFRPDTGRKSELEPFYMTCPDAQMAVQRLANTEWDEPELGEEVSAVDWAEIRRVSLDPV